MRGRRSGTPAFAHEIRASGIEPDAPRAQRVAPPVRHPPGADRVPRGATPLTRPVHTRSRADPARARTVRAPGLPGDMIGGRRHAGHRVARGGGERTRCPGRDGKS
ncbi:hypothetical protein YT1_5513 [Rhodococcus ruber]|nr:hypothetical protein YT1_5513 [Rhodococcus ruber]